MLEIQPKLCCQFMRHAALNNQDAQAAMSLVLVLALGKRNKDDLANHHYAPQRGRRHGEAVLRREGTGLGDVATRQRRHLHSQHRARAPEFGDAMATRMRGAIP